MEKQTTIKFKRWEDLDITDDFIFSRVMLKKLCLNPTTKSTRRAAPQLPSPTGVLRGGSGFAEALPRLAKIAQYIAIFRFNPSLPTQAVLGEPAASTTVRSF